MSTNLATLMVGLGYDLSALEKGSPEAFRLINQQTLGMSAEMKRSSREGAESLRLISENLGLHVSRPLSRILTQEFPGFAAGLQAILGGAVFGAVADIGFRAFEKVSQSVEHARKAQEELEAATRKTGEVFTSALQSFEKADKLRSLSGLDKKLFEIDFSAVEEGRKKIDELAAAMEKEAKAAAEAHKWTTELLAGIGQAAHLTFSSDAALGIEEIDKRSAEFTRRFDELSKLDALHGTRDSAKFVADQLADAAKSLDTMKQANRLGSQVTGGDFEQGFTYSTAPSDDEVERQRQFVAYLGQQKQIADSIEKSRKDSAGDARQAEALAAAKALHEEMVRDFQQDAKDYNLAANALWEVMAGLEKLQTTSLSESAARFDRQRKLNFPDIGTVAPPPGAPQLGDQAELKKITDDQNASWQKAGQIIEQIESPMQKYQTGLAILKELEDQGRLSTEQFALAQQKLQEQLVQSENHVQRMEQQLEKLLSHSDSATDGVRAFFLQLEIDSAENGKFAFDLLNKGLKGFEDTLTKAVFEGKAKWKDLFRSMGEEAFKFMLNKDISGLFSMVGQSSIGKSIGLDRLIPNVGGGAGMTAAATTLQTGSTLLVTGATELQAAAAQLSLGGVGGAAGASTFNPFSFVPGFASGTDSAPGGFAWVGEQGPELLNLPGGSSVTPSSSLRSGGGGDLHYYDQRGAVVTDDLMRKGDAARMMAAARPALIGEAIANFSEIQRRSVPR